MRGRSTSRRLLACAAFCAVPRVRLERERRQLHRALQGQRVPASAKADVQQAGGTLAYSYGQIGVAIAVSDNASFGGNAAARPTGVDGVSRRRASRPSFRSRRGEEGRGSAAGDLRTRPDNDSLSGLQWDMRQIQTPQAHAVTGGSPRSSWATSTPASTTPTRICAELDADSATALSGVPVPGAAAANDDNGHGTHTAGTIAAAQRHRHRRRSAECEGRGHQGGQRRRASSSRRPSSARSCGRRRTFRRHEQQLLRRPVGVQLQERSGAAGDLEGRAAGDQFAQQQGVTVVASAGNDSDDISHPTRRRHEPGLPAGQRAGAAITNACAVVPVEVPGVVGVSATGSAFQDRRGRLPGNLKSFYSSSASERRRHRPGGDSVYSRRIRSTNGRVPLDLVRASLRLLAQPAGSLRRTGPRRTATSRERRWRRRTSRASRR